jgi:DNA-binding MarR family transcriptional regulator
MSKLRAEIQQQKPFSSLAEETFLNLQRTADRMLGIESELLSGHDLTMSQYNVLRILRGAGDRGHPCQEVGARMISRVPDVTRLLDRLEKAGLVTRQRCTEDRRVVYARIQPKGLEVLAALDEPVQQLAPQMFAALSNAELQQLNDLLVRARGN